MQTFTRIEIKWIINTLDHAIDAQEAIIKEHINDNTLELNLLKLQCENDKSVRKKLTSILNSNDKRVEIE